MENETQVQQLSSIPSVVPEEEKKSNVSLEIKPVEELSSTKSEPKDLKPEREEDPPEITKEDIFIRPNSKESTQNSVPQKKVKKKRVISERQRLHCEKMRKLKSQKRAAKKVPPPPKNPPKLERSPAVVQEREEPPVVKKTQNNIDPDLSFFDKVERMFNVMHKYESMRGSRQSVRQPNTSHQAAQPAVQRNNKPSQAKRSVQRPQPETVNFLSNFQTSFKNPFGF